MKTEPLFNLSSEHAAEIQTPQQFVPRMQRGDIDDVVETLGHRSAHEPRIVTRYQHGYHPLRQMRLSHFSFPKSAVPAA